MRYIKKALGLVGFCLLLLMAGDVKAQMKTAKQVVSQYRNLFTSPPSKIPGTVAVDAPLLGNGFTAAAIAGPPEQQNYYLSRNDFWRLRSGFNESFPAVLGKLKIQIPALTGASYQVVQALYEGTTLSDFSKGDTSVRIQSLMVATKDWLLIDIVNTGKAAVQGNVLLELPQAEQFNINPPLENKFPDTISYGTGRHGMQWLQRGFVKGVDIPAMAAVAVKIIGKESNEFLILPGKKLTLVCAFASSFKTKGYLQEVQRQVRQATATSIAQARKEHFAWWARYWEQSFVNIPDSLIAHQYYRSQYNMAACSRDPKFPPGIFGSWVTREIPAWNGDYHLNYNYSAPFYALYSSNHLDQALPYEAPIIDFMPRGEYYSAKIAAIPIGSLYPVGIGPLGIETTRKNEIMSRYSSGFIERGETEDEGLFFGQKSNAAYCATNLSMRFYRTYDPVYTKRIYPFIRSVAVFWQHYLKKENGRYIIENDAIHEGTIGTKNPILSLGLVPMVLKTAIDMSVLLNVDAELRSDWQEKHDQIANYSVQVRNGKTVFRYSEKGTEWWENNTLGIQHIYPSGQIGLNSDPKLLEIARNTIAEMNRWQDFNGSNSLFPAAVRVGYSADTILNRLRDYCLHTYPNGFQLDNPHGIENCSTVPNTINEMLCMSHQNVLRVFAVWPKDKDASFSNIRCEGAFLATAELKNKSVKFLKIISEKGRTLVLQNPWPGKALQIKSNKRPIMRKTGAEISLPTSAGEELIITPVQ